MRVRQTSIACGACECIATVLGESVHGLCLTCDTVLCRMELFTFLEMGKSIDDIDIEYIHIDLNAQASAQDRGEVIQFFERKFDHFRISEAQCFDAAQRDQMLAIIGAVRGIQSRQHGPDFALLRDLAQRRGSAVLLVSTRHSRAPCSSFGRIQRLKFHAEGPSEGRLRREQARKKLRISLSCRSHHNRSSQASHAKPPCFQL